jgi:hypothetical protein
MTGKISRLPQSIQDQLNTRLDNGEKGKPLLNWLNALPEAKTMLAADFEGQPISRQNLYEWTQRGFRTWKMRQTAFEFAASQQSDDTALQLTLSDTLTEKLVHWMAFRYAAAAHTLSPTDTDPDAELRRLRSFCADIVALRRGDLSAGRLALEQRRLALEEAAAQKHTDEQFWEWTKRPDIQEKLHPNRDPEKIRRDVERMLNRRLLGIRDPAADLPDETADPAILI